MQPANIYIPPRIPLTSVWRIDGAWVIFTRAPRSVSDPRTALGERLVLYDTGEAWRVNITAEGEEETQILPCDAERKTMS